MTRTLPSNRRRSSTTVRVDLAASCSSPTIRPTPRPTLPYPSALGGWAGAGASAGDGGVANGIYGFTDNGGGYAVVGVNGHAVSGSGAGVLGTNGGGTGVEGRSESVAASASAILGIITSTSPGGFSSAVRGQNNGTGGLGIGVYGSQAGSGWGMYATSVSGIGLHADGGTGVGVSADGGVGLEAFGTSGAGVEALGSTYGVTASGSIAPIHLTPAGTPGSAHNRSALARRALRRWKRQALLLPGIRNAGNLGEDDASGPRQPSETRR